MTLPTVTLGTQTLITQPGFIVNMPSGLDRIRTFVVIEDVSSQLVPCEWRIYARYTNGGGLLYAVSPPGHSMPGVGKWVISGVPDSGQSGTEIFVMLISGARSRQIICTIEQWFP